MTASVPVVRDSPRSKRWFSVAHAVCGIFGTYNYFVPHKRREIIECLLTGLGRLEYRGYDSAGFAVDSQPCGVPSPGGPTGGDGTAAPPLIV